MTTIERVQQFTGKLVTVEQIGAAAAIIESYIGKTADTLNAADLITFDKCVAYQCVFNLENGVFTGGGYKSVRQDDSTVQLSDHFPIAPLVRITARQFSFSSKRISQIKMVPPNAS